MAKAKSSVLLVGGFRPTLEPLASNFGLRPVGLAGEEWPGWEGKPLMFVCQMNLTTAPAVPELLAGIQLIAFFLEPEFRDWRLRAYRSLEGLVPMAVPDGAPRVKKGFECRWEEGPRNAARTKIGGTPTTIQGECWWDLKDHPADPKYCLQINSEEKAGLIFGDGGTIYLARGTSAGYEDEWFLDWQCF